MATALLIASAALVGFMIGAVGIGGVLLIPALVALAGLTPHQASATALFTFIFTGILGTWLFQRKGSIDWRQSAAVCSGAVLFSYLGAMANAAVGDRVLLLLIALLIIFAGAYVFFPRAARERETRESLPLLIAIGALAGFGSGFSGAGGPLFSVPLMLVAGFSPLLAIGTSQVLQIFSAASGTLANLRYGDIQWALVLWITLAELIGVVAGVKLAHTVGQGTLKRGAGVMCLVVGVAMLIRSF